MIKIGIIKWSKEIPIDSEFRSQKSGQRWIIVEKSSDSEKNFTKALNKFLEGRIG